MQKEEIRAVIKYLNIKGLSPMEIKSDLDATLNEYSPTLKTIYKWVAEFNRGNVSIKDAPRSGRPKTATSEEMVKNVQAIVLTDRRLKLIQIAEATGISKERVSHILHEELGMRKLCARWVPRLITPEQKQHRVATSGQCLQLIRHYPDFFNRFITVDETWLHHYTPETKIQSMQWTAKGEPAPKKAKTVPSAGKILATVFWDAKGIIFMDCLEKGKTITGLYYANLLDKLIKHIREKRPGLSKKKIFFHHDNAPAHTSKVSMEKIKKLHFELVPHPPYSPDLAPSDFFLFKNLKKFLAGQRFLSNSEVITSVAGYFADLDKFAYKNGIKDFEKRLIKCIQLVGDYVEK